MDSPVQLNPLHFIDPRFPHLFDELVGNVLVNSTNPKMVELCRSYMQTVGQISDLKTPESELGAFWKVVEKQIEEIGNIWKKISEENAVNICLRKQIFQISNKVGQGSWQNQVIHDSLQKQNTLNTDKVLLMQKYHEMYKLVEGINTELQKSQLTQKEMGKKQFRLQKRVQETTKNNLSVEIQCAEIRKNIQKEGQMLEKYKRKLQKQKLENKPSEQRFQPVDGIRPILNQQEKQETSWKAVIGVLFWLWLSMCLMGTLYIFL